MAIVRPLDPVALRADFPIFERDFAGRQLAYLDSAATSLKPRVVAEAMTGYLTQYSANVHRGIYQIGEEATEAYERARTTVARFLNARSPREIVMVRNATEAINLVAYSWGRTHIERADTIVLTELEHHANLVPWQLLTQERDADLEFVPFGEDGALNMESYEVLLRTRPKLVAFAHVSNGLGTINPAREMVAKAHDAGALVLLDGAQSEPHQPVKVQEL
ncbi:MAG: aminotransferase class V-fold PLP-dependent enzyme, partial [Chloroflexota bacterium]|nr:aminotransferase class V-fold PLP-dependent enzyme [Chloroflexota bacterium]